MFCPECESEYEAGITRCSDHDVELVESLAGRQASQDDSEARFVVLHTMSSPAEAEMVNDIFLQNGLRSAVQSGGADALAPLLSSTAPGAAILVDERDFDRAQELYTAFFGDDTSPLTGGAADVSEDDN